MCIDGKELDVTICGMSCTSNISFQVKNKKNLTSVVCYTTVELYIPALQSFCSY